MKNASLEDSISSIADVTAEKASAAAYDAIVGKNPQRLAEIVSTFGDHIDNRILLQVAVHENNEKATFVLVKSGLEEGIKNDALRFFQDHCPGSVKPAALIIDAGVSPPARSASLRLIEKSLGMELTEDQRGVWDHMGDSSWKPETPLAFQVNPEIIEKANVCNKQLLADAFFDGAEIEAKAKKIGSENPVYIIARTVELTKDVALDLAHAFETEDPRLEPLYKLYESDADGSTLTDAVQKITFEIGKPRLIESFILTQELYQLQEILNRPAADGQAMVAVPK